MNPSDYLNAPDVFVCDPRGHRNIYANRLAARLTKRSLYCVIENVLASSMRIGSC